MEIKNEAVTAQEILKLVDEGYIKAKTIVKSAITGDFIQQMKKSGWRLIRTDDLGKTLKCYFAKE
ncbi:MAG: hypothetical protein HOE30_23330 [Deltaproteobacteria bacterium]|jgi:hypothetical protein|nr:hypothetical protein [Deltaproteobacteria bacterium]MBT4637181.1 hypothetical protein [Deltaproteobacteria bacterium]